MKTNTEESYWENDPFKDSDKDMIFKEYKWGSIISNQQIGFMISWGKAFIPNVTYLCIDLPFLSIQIYTEYEVERWTVKSKEKR